MKTVSFDSYRVVNILLETGYTKEQAEGLLEVVKETDISGFASLLWPVCRQPSSGYLLLCLISFGSDNCYSH